MNFVKFNIEVQHSYTDNDQEENEYKVIFAGTNSSARYENTFNEMRDVTNWIGDVVRDTLGDKGMY